MWWKPPRFLLLLLFPLVSPLLFSSDSYSDACDPRSLPDPLTLRPDRLTVLINGYSEARLPLLHSLAASYAVQPLVAAVLVLWGNTSTPAAALASLASDGGVGSAPISVIRQSSASLNARFLPRAGIRTRAVAVCDDDVEVDARTLAFAFSVWDSRGGASLVGLFARSHDLDLEQRRWIYAMHPDRYSIVLTKFMILGTDYLRRYSCWGRLSEAQQLVDRERNCEDILMNFVAAKESGAGPVLVGGRVRDWGDPRNNGGGVGDGGGRVVGIERVGLSARSGHRKKRGDCITEFHRMLGEMPLKYSYGKVVEGVGEQGLCEKGGKLVLCDHQD
ncbi:glycosyltransferase family protein 64 [Canna indica]|uniref:Glycosyltransferase family protein 64 n=1 Tax=Canna indica TaxID=4628 RepID=A0AAQ3JVC8_9LILI|nr:glycosyltransferase family protein 64 [Canna indica]